MNERIVNPTNIVFNSQCAAIDLHVFPFQNFPFILVKICTSRQANTGKQKTIYTSTMLERVKNLSKSKSH